MPNSSRRGGERAQRGEGVMTNERLCGEARVAFILFESDTLISALQVLRM